MALLSIDEGACYRRPRDRIEDFESFKYSPRPISLGRQDSGAATQDGETSPEPCAV